MFDAESEIDQRIEDNDDIVLSLVAERRALRNRIAALEDWSRHQQLEINKRDEYEAGLERVVEAARARYYCTGIRGVDEMLRLEGDVIDALRALGAHENENSREVTE